MGALPTMPDPLIPEGLSARILAAVQPYRAAHRPERETLAALLVRRTVVCTLAFAFAVAFGAALWGWVLRIAQVAGRSLSYDLLALWDTAKDLWTFFQLLAEVADVLQPTAQELVGVAQRIGSPLAIYGPFILTVYAGVLLLGTLLCWRAFSRRDRRRLGHV
jgi:hypothetical protein